MGRPLAASVPVWDAYFQPYGQGRADSGEELAPFTSCDGLRNKSSLLTLSHEAYASMVREWAHWPTRNHLGCFLVVFTNCGFTVDIYFLRSYWKYSV